MAIISKYIQLDDQGKNYPDSERLLKRNHRQQLQADNVFTYDVKNPNRIDKRRNIFLSWVP